MVVRINVKFLNYSLFHTLKPVLSNMALVGKTVDIMIKDSLQTLS